LKRAHEISDVLQVPVRKTLRIGNLMQSLK